MLRVHFNGSEEPILGSRVQVSSPLGKNDELVLRGKSKSLKKEKKTRQKISSS
jgi:hypothetical protein